MSSLLKAVNFLADFKRVNHRMHHRLFVADGGGLEWVGHSPDGEETLHEEPPSAFWQRLRPRLLGWLVPEDQL